MNFSLGVLFIRCAGCDILGLRIIDLSVMVETKFQPKSTNIRMV